MEGHAMLAARAAQAKVQPVHDRDADTAIDVLTRAFAADPAARWAYPDENEYWQHFPRFIRALGGKAFEQGTAFLSSGGVGAALWLPPGVYPDDDAIISLIGASVSGAKQRELFAMMEEMGRYHPSEAHWYLPFLGVDPAHHRRGLGTDLIRYGLDACDRDRVPAYLEASNPTNRALYERFGFAVVGTIQAGSSPPIYPMLRAAR